MPRRPQSRQAVSKRCSCSVVCWVVCWVIAGPPGSSGYASSAPCRRDRRASRTATSTARCDGRSSRSGASRLGLLSAPAAPVVPMPTGRTDRPGTEFGVNGASTWLGIRLGEGGAEGVLARGDGRLQSVSPVIVAESADVPSDVWASIAACLTAARSASVSPSAGARVVSRPSSPASSSMASRKSSRQLHIHDAPGTPGSSHDPSWMRCGAQPGQVGRPSSPSAGARVTPAAAERAAASSITSKIRPK